ncbi:MAG: hypothetical protein NVS3B3_18710 [Aquirhabdus sp.]
MDLKTITMNELIAMRLEPIFRAVRNFLLTRKERALHRHIELIRRNQENDRRAIQHLNHELMLVKMRRRQ